jgi:cytochrome c-type biogenesis protein CcmH
MLMDGQSDDEIRTFLVERYGDFVLYRPAMKGNTLLLWLAPVLLLLLGGAVVARAVRSHRPINDIDDGNVNDADTPSSIHHGQKN